MNKTFGTLVFINGQAFLQLEIGEYIALNDSFIIEVFAEGKYHRISYEQAINTFCADMPNCPLFTGLEARVKRKEVA